MLRVRVLGQDIARNASGKHIHNGQKQHARGEVSLKKELFCLGDDFAREAEYIREA